jgi:Fic family protein
MPPELDTDLTFLERLIYELRAVMAEEEDATPDEGSNPTDDEGGVEILLDTPANLTRETVREEIDAMDPQHQNELVALMWLGRGDAEAEDWDELLQQATERRETPTSHYLLDHPMVAEYLAEGLDKLDLSTAEPLRTVR